MEIVYLQLNYFPDATQFMKFLSDEFIFSMNINSPRSLANIVQKSDQRIGIFLDLFCEESIQFLKLVDIIIKFFTFA